MGCGASKKKEEKEEKKAPAESGKAESEKKDADTKSSNDDASKDASTTDEQGAESKAEEDKGAAETEGEGAGDAGKDAAPVPVGPPPFTEIDTEVVPVAELPDEEEDGIHIYEVYNMLNQSAQMYMLAENKQTLVIDLRAKSEWDKSHIAGAICVDMTTGDVLISLSSLTKIVEGDEYSTEGVEGLQEHAYKEVILYEKSEPSEPSTKVMKVIKEDDSYLSVRLLRGGFEAFEKEFPFMCRTKETYKDYVQYPSLVLQPSSLFLCQDDAALNQDIVDNLGITHVINMNSADLVEKQNPFKHIHYISDYQCEDLQGDAMKSIISRVGVLSSLVSKGARVLAHCKLGLSDGGPTGLTIVYLMTHLKWSLEKAYYYVREQRENVKMSAAFVTELSNYEETLLGEKVTDTESELFW